MSEQNKNQNRKPRVENDAFLRSLESITAETASSEQPFLRFIGKSAAALAGVRRTVLATGDRMVAKAESWEAKARAINEREKQRLDESRSRRAGINAVGDAEKIIRDVHKDMRHQEAAAFDEAAQIVGDEATRIEVENLSPQETLPPHHRPPTPY